MQVNGKAYPPVREMIIAKAMSKSAAGNQGIVSSICPISTDIGMQVTQAQADPLFGLNPGMNAIVDRIKGPLQGLNCLARPLPTNPVGTTCTMIAALASPLMDGGCKSPGSACSAAKLKTPAQPLLDSYCDAQEQAYLAAGGTAGGKGDPSRQPACQVPLLTPSMNASDFTNGSCATGTDPGWCYVTGSAASPCAQTVFFTSGQPPAGSSVTLVCPGVSQDAGP